MEEEQFMMINGSFLYSSYDLYGGNYGDDQLHLPGDL